MLAAKERRLAVRRGARNVICWRPDSPNLTDPMLAAIRWCLAMTRRTVGPLFGIHRRRNGRPEPDGAARTVGARSADVGVQESEAPRGASDVERGCCRRTGAAGCCFDPKARRRSRKVALLGVLCRPDVPTPTSASMSRDTMTKTGRARTRGRLGVGRVAASKATRPSPNVTTQNLKGQHA